MLKRNFIAIAIIGLTLLLTSGVFGQPNTRKAKKTTNKQTGFNQVELPSGMVKAEPKTKTGDYIGETEKNLAKSRGGAGSRRRTNQLVTVPTDYPNAKSEMPDSNRRANLGDTGTHEVGHVKGTKTAKVNSVAKVGLGVVGSKRKSPRKAGRQLKP